MTCTLPSRLDSVASRLQANGKLQAKSMVFESPLRTPQFHIEMYLPWLKM